MTKDQQEKFDELEKAILEARYSLGICDNADCIDWLATATIRIGELVASNMTKVRNQ